MRATDNTPQCRGKSEIHYDSNSSRKYYNYIYIDVQRIIKHVYDNGK